MQNIVQEFDADFTKFDAKFKQYGKVVDDFSKKASKIKVDFGSSTRFSKDMDNIESKLNKIKSVKFTTLENNIGKVTAKLVPMRDELEKSSKLLDKIGKGAGMISLLRNVKDLVDQMKKLNQNVNGLGTSLSNANNHATTFTNNIRTGNGYLDSMFGSVQRLVPFMSALFVLSTVQSFFSELYRVNQQFELFQLKGTAALDGSERMLKYYYESLKQIDIKSLFDIEELESGTLKALNRRLKFSKEELQSLANTAEAVGTKGAQSFNQIIEATLDAQQGQFRRLEELGVGIDAKGDTIKATFAGITTEVEKGSQGIVRYIVNLDKMNGAYKISEQSAKTLEGKVSSLKTGFDELLIKINDSGGKNVFNFLLDSADGFIIALKKILELWNSTPMQKLFSTIGKYNEAIDRTQYDKSLGINNLPLVRQETRTNINNAVSGFNKFSSRDNFGESYFNPALIKSNDELKRFSNETKKLIDFSAKLKVNNSEAFDTLTKYYDAINAEIEARRLKDDGKDKEADKAARLNESLKDLQDRADREKLDALNDMIKLEEQIKVEALKEQLRFLKEGSTKYLEAKRKIDLQEIELERTKSFLLLKEKLRQATATPYINSAGKADMKYTEPTDEQVNNAFKQENDLFNLRIKVLNNSTNQAIKDTNLKFAENQRSLYEKIVDFVEGSEDKEKKAILQKYNTIQKAINELRENGLVPEQKVFVDAYESKIKILEEFELKLLQIKNAQKGSVEASRASVVRNPNEKNYSFNRRVEIAGITQQSDNTKEQLSFADFFALKYPNIKSDPQFKEIYESLLDGVVIIGDKLKEAVNKQNVQLSFTDNAISKVFGLDQNSPTFSKEVAAIKQGLDKLLDVYFQFTDSLIALEKKKEDEADKNIQKLEKRLEQEKELKQKGIANNYNLLKSEIEDQERIKKQAADNQIKLQRLQIASNAAMAISNLIATNINLVYGASKLPPPANVIVAGISIASMAGILASGIAQFKAIGKAEEGGVLGGKRHSQGGTLIEAEEGEGFIRRASSIPNKNLVLNLNNFKKKVTGNNLHELLRGTGVTFPSQNDEWKDISSTFMAFHKHHFETNQMLIERFERLEESLEGINSNTSRIPKKQYSTLRDGRIMVIDGNSTQIID